MLIHPTKQKLVHYLTKQTKPAFVKGPIGTCLLKALCYYCQESELD